MKNIKISDLKKGDILLFSPLYSSLESRLISLITNAPVTHSALSYYDNSKIAEEIAPNAQVNNIRSRVGNRKITVMRLNSYNKDMTKVVNEAEKYIIDKVPYSEPGLIFGAVFMLFKRAIIGENLQRTLIPMMKIIISNIIRLLDKGVYHDNHPMVCSQFIFNCYENAGEEYKLIIDNKLQKTTLLEQVQKYINENSTALENKLTKDISEINSKNHFEKLDREVIIKEIYREFKKDKCFGFITRRSYLEEFVLTVHEFCSVLNYFFNNSRADKLIENSDRGLVSKSIGAMIKDEAYFVTPGDLLNNCRNLIKLGVLDNNS
ncbi:hypothetical protein BJV85_001408 [Clostridium acetobutylicum]|uniref:Uncharacterized protein n=1 Tax=Clostridium acetobutylicum (strain ATCC 824 / DSM 792 / JCM 1419 / IAM 19013 / LMG 5710 / NBRC 13948 / NRRL B-527 / VKM B-1787 / 2291 / W) TaxID=272562 RepID=Q97G92_CLOAB|nr:MULTISPECIES: hypothetical protein [Clostridium]AAK80431.1 Hypothetical protein CA_C2477 [Clostridium acetobutylicum ATCC 824]ADZ21528.1 Conserved hypothetical protein [Clostridium acetobutylicum EA 2018]AEI32372.1 hypothetical protein SMB_G2512 [Clostridium acetobutylicum DSM 1731]AWV79152.1 hypothetical protein DK921_03365 [Clostridium acetobutylicum]MBC2394885.1 hypothetical protein [Clostridium acetobutylicum]